VVHQTCIYVTLDELSAVYVLYKEVIVFYKEVYTESSFVPLKA